MHPDQVAVVLRTGIALFALIAVVQLLLQPAFADGFRQRMFALRRELFLYMLDGNVRSDEPAYVELVSTMNGMLRFAERVTLSRLVITALIANHGRAYREKFEANLRRLDPETRKVLGGYRVRIGKEILRHVILTSPVAWFFIVMPAVIYATIRVVFSKEPREGGVGRARHHNKSAPRPPVSEPVDAQRGRSAGRWFGAQVGDAAKSTVIKNVPVEGMEADAEALGGWEPLAA